MIDTIPNPVETADLLTALAQLEVAGRRVTILNWNNSGWRKNRYVHLWEVFHVKASSCITLTQAQAEDNAPKMKQSDLL